MVLPYIAMLAALRGIVLHTGGGIMVPKGKRT